DREKDGVGGTGHSTPRSVEKTAAVRGGDGIGGTGIVGIVTGFGSVCVNGLEVAYDDLTAIDSNGAAESPVDLAVGQLVVVEATGRGDRLRAKRIAVRDAAVGPVFEIDPVRGALVVLGQDVRVGPDVPLGDRASQRPLALADIAIGDFLAVSGLRQADGIVVATRVDRVAPSDRVSVSGPLRPLESGGFGVGKLRIANAAAIDANLSNRSALVIGRLGAQTGILDATRIEPSVRWEKAPERVAIEGLVQGDSVKGRFRTNFADVEASSASAAVGKVKRDDRVIVSGKWSAGGLVLANEIRIEAPRARTPESPMSDGKNQSTLPQAELRATTEMPDREQRIENGERPESVEAPEVDVPEAVERPEAEAPEIEKPEVEQPEVERPRVERPEVETPEIEKPEVERPEIETPEIEKPEVERPEVERPEVERPEIEKPEVERPELEKPETEIPEVERPESD
ncbi:MAG: DUF5666 domain-containing protein, partial [Proteobacteria bacterium]|nr:DUF5666 domain-containing protein [Pseudomonadota bacterium]